LKLKEVVTAKSSMNQLHSDENQIESPGLLKFHKILEEQNLKKAHNLAHDHSGFQKMRKNLKIEEGDSEFEQ